MENKKKTVILRYDIDSPFVYRKNFLKKVLNRVYLSNSKLPGKSFMPGNFEALYHLLKLQNKFQLQGTFFLELLLVPHLKF